MKFLEKAEGHLQRLGEARLYFILIAVIAAITAFQMTSLSLALHHNFIPIACDTAAFQNTLVNILHGNGFRDTAYAGPNFLGLHSTFVLLLIAPLYAFFPSADTLFTLQIFAVYAAALPLYGVALEFLRRPLLAFLAAMAVMLNPIFYHMALAPFHPETWILTAVLASFYFYRRNRLRAFWISVVIGLTSGEQAAFIYLALGLSLWLYDDGIAWHRRYGIQLAGAAFAWFLLVITVVAPMMRSPGQYNVLAEHYTQWNAGSFSSLTGALLDEPLAAVVCMFNPGRWFYVATLVGVPLALAFLFRRSRLLLLPVPVYFLMAPQEFFLFFHAYYYQFAVLAGVIGLLLFLDRWPVSTRLGPLILIATVFLNLFLLFPVVSFYATWTCAEDDAYNRPILQAFARIPADAGVFCQHRYSAYLSNRPIMVMGDLGDEKRDFTQVMADLYPTTLVHPEQIDYIVCDMLTDQCGSHILQGDAKAKRRGQQTRDLLATGKWQNYWNQNNFVILRRTPETTPPSASHP